MVNVKSKLKRVTKALWTGRTYKYWLQNKKDTGDYRTTLAGLAGWQRKSATTAAVVVHLYYVESWPTILRQLQKLHGLQFDLFMTIPKQNAAYAEKVLADYPTAHNIIVPNRGRDVLPFMQVAKKLQDMGYDRLLKLHTKKSTHRTDGEMWFSEMLEALIPSSKNAQKKLMQTLDLPNAGVIGPAGQYLQLSVNFEANGTHMTTLLNRIYDEKISHQTLQVERLKHGFFAGTMFWLRIDSIAPLLKFNPSPKSFEPENGQIDATLAHALERVLCLVPEIEGKDMYEIEGSVINKVEYDAGIIPDWSNVYLGPKSN